MVGPWEQECLLYCEPCIQSGVLDIETVLLVQFLHLAGTQTGKKTKKQGYRQFAKSVSVSLVSTPCLKSSYN